jgi:LPS export ABC transporter protein LptC
VRRAWLLLAFGVALALWLWRPPREEVQDNQTHGTGPATEPGYVATGAVMLETDADGQPLYRLRAERIAQPAPTDDIQLTAPQFVYQGGTVWTLTAKNGVLPPSAQQISLAGDVVATGEKPGADTMHIYSASLSVDMQTRHADTDDPVTMDWGPNRMWARGMHADMQTDHLRLTSPVYGVFTRKRK